MPSKLTKLRLDEVSAVDSPASPGANIALFKRAESDPVDRVVGICKSLFESGRSSSDFDAALADELRVDRMLDISGAMQSEFQSLRESVIAAAADFEVEERDRRIRENVESFLRAARAKLQQIEGSGQMTDSTSESETAVANAAPSGTVNKGESAVASDKKTNLESQVEALTKQVEALTKQAEGHGLTVSKGNDGSVTLAKANDETITGPDGATIRKSEVGETQFNVIKSMNERMTKMEAERQRETFAKRADTELPNVGGDAVQKGAVLQAIETVQDEDTRKALRGHLETLNKMLGEAFVEKGHSAPNAGGDAEVKLQKMAQERAGTSGETFEVAYTNVLKTSEGQRLYSEANDTRMKG